MTSTTEPTTPVDLFPPVDLPAPAAVPAPAPAVAEQAALEPTQTPEQAPAHPVAEPTEPEPATSASALAAACATGTVKLFRLRGTGTVRRLQFLTDGTPAREVAEWYRMRVEEGASVRHIAEEAAVSKATVRRNLYALAVTESIEDGDLDELWGGPEDTELVLAGWDEDDEPAAAPADEPFVCDWEGHASAIDEAGICPVCQ